MRIILALEALTGAGYVSALSYILWLFSHG